MKQSLDRKRLKIASLPLAMTKKQINLFMKCTTRETGSEAMTEQLFSVVENPRREVIVR